jgi:hypothetical protein
MDIINNQKIIIIFIVLLLSFLIYLIMTQNNKKVKSKINKHKINKPKRNKKTRAKSKTRIKSKTRSSNKNKKQRFSNIPKYQIKKVNQKSRKLLLDKCGLPDIPETQHCFADDTHHTCCEIGPKSSKYADSSGNPIGKLADDVFKKLPSNHPKKKYYQQNGRRPWCTCFGSKVCGNYAKMFPKDTKIKFINAPYDNRLGDKIMVHNSQIEEEIRKKFNVINHRTPGV